MRLNVRLPMPRATRVVSEHFAFSRNHHLALRLPKTLAPSRTVRSLPMTSSIPNCKMPRARGPRWTYPEFRQHSSTLHVYTFGGNMVHPFPILRHPDTLTPAPRPRSPRFLRGNRLLHQRAATPIGPCHSSALLPLALNPDGHPIAPRRFTVPGFKPPAPAQTPAPPLPITHSPTHTILLFPLLTLDPFNFPRLSFGTFNFGTLELPPLAITNMHPPTYTRLANLPPSSLTFACS